MTREERALDLLQRLRAWDHFDGAADGPFWRREIDAVLNPHAFRPGPVPISCALCGEERRFHVEDR
jgi:hypothetical protein